MRSTIYASEVVANRARRFGSATIYYPAKLIRADGSEATLLLTDGELATAAARGNNNREDIEAAIAAHESERKTAWRMLAVLAVSGSIMAAIIAGVVLWPV